MWETPPPPPGIPTLCVACEPQFKWSHIVVLKALQNKTIQCYSIVFTYVKQDSVIFCGKLLTILLLGKL